MEPEQLQHKLPILQALVVQSEVGDEIRWMRLAVTLAPLMSIKPYLVR
jgi:hypothetical protein